MVSLWAPFLSAQHYLRRVDSWLPPPFSEGCDWRRRFGGRTAGLRWRLRVLLSASSLRRWRRCDALPRLSIGDLSFERLLDAPFSRSFLIGSVHRECVRSAFASVHLLNRRVRSGVFAHSLVRRSLIGASFLLGLHLRRVSLGRASHCSVCCGVSLGLVSNAGRLVGVRLCACSFLGVCVCVSHLPFVAGYLVDPASSHMLVSKIKPCMSKYKRLVL